MIFKHSIASSLVFDLNNFEELLTFPPKTGNSSKFTCHSVHCLSPLHSYKK